MKKRKAGAVCALLFWCCMHAAAQSTSVPLNEPDYNKPQLFADLPQKINLKPALLDNLFQFSVGAPVALRLGENFPFEGKIVSRSSAQDADVATVVIRCSNRPGATFTFTRRTNSDGTVAYLGRILSRSNSDAFEIAREDGEYVLLKKNLYDLMNE